MFHRGFLFNLKYVFFPLAIKKSDYFRFYRQKLHEDTEYVM